MDIRDEIDAMLDSLKNGGKSVSSGKPLTRTKQENPPPAVKPAAVRKSVYDNMSVDDLLNALSAENKPKKTVQVKSAEQTISASAEKSTVSENVAEKNNVLSNTRTFQSASAYKPVEFTETFFAENTEKTPISKPSSNTTLKESVADEKQTFDSEKIQKLLRKKNKNQALEDKETEKPEPLPKEDIPENKITDMLSEEETITSDEFTDSEETETEFDDEISDEEISAPSKVKKGFFAGIKSLFSKSENNDADDQYELSDEEDNIFHETEPEAVDDKEDISVESGEIAEQPEVSEEINSDNNSEHVSENVPEEDPRSATELIDAALAAIEDMQTEECFIETEESETADNPEIVIADDEKPDEEETTASDNLISGIREEAAETIAEISSEIAGDDGLDEITDETEDFQENISNSENIDEEKSIEIDVKLDEKDKKSRFVAVLEKILEENPDKIADERCEKIEEDEIDVSLDKKKGKFKQRIYAVCGVAFTVLAVIGLVSVIKFSISHFRSFTSGDENKSNFTDIIYPAVIMDIESFNNPSELSSEQIISASLWSLVMSADDMEKYEKTFDVISVPAIDVEVYAARLFGENLPVLTHSTVGSGELKFYYNEETKSYNVPVNPIAFTYEPEIKSVVKNGGEYTVTVDYIKELPAWMKESKNFSEEISKTVEFKLAESGDSYIILSMTVINVNAVL